MKARFVEIPEFVRLLFAFEHTAFRLETKERYNEPDEAPVVERFLGRGELDESYMDDWIELLAPRIADGQRMDRVRVVSEPHSDYTRFGLALARCNLRAGEDIRYLPRDRAAELELPDHDFWLVDSTMLLILRFGTDDLLLGAEVVTDPAVVVKYGFYRDVARHYATAWQEYVRRGVELPEGA